MKTQNIKSFAIAIMSAGLIGLSLQAGARPNVSRNGSSTLHSGLLRTAAACQPATAAIDLDINNVRARIMTGGDMWWNIGIEKAAYEVPKGGGASSLFAGSCWIGGYDKQGQLKVAAQTYRQDGNDYWPGALDANNTISANGCSAWDRFWVMYKSDIIAFADLAKSGNVPVQTAYPKIYDWPGYGNKYARDANGGIINYVSGRTYAPFIDVDGNGVYNPETGDYPDITGDEFIWYVFNDVGNVKLQTQTAAIGLEVQTSAFSYSSNDYLNDATFYNYHVINRGALNLDSAYISTWSDADLGWYLDDYIGCDTLRSLGILYNGNTIDGVGQPGTYGSHVPMVGVDFFQGPIKTVTNPTTGQQSQVTLGMTNFDYYNNDFTDIGNPSNGIEIYNYMTGSLAKGERFTDDFRGPGIKSKGYGSGPISHYVFFGSPDPGKGEWSECTCTNPPGDRRFVHSSGPFQLLSGAVENITIGAVWVPDVGGCPQTSFTTLQAADDVAQALFEAHFKTIEGPEAPRLVIREMDKKLICYLINDYGSNNYREGFGYVDSPRYKVSSTKAVIQKSADSLYKFEGYRVFQLANSSVTAAQIFNSSTGEVDPTVASEVFQCDLKNGVTKIVNYVKNSAISDTTYVPQLKVSGKDSGITHSFVLTQDAFATGNNKALVNYRTYYFVAVAYGYNNFAPFNSRNAANTQDVAYLGSLHSAGGNPITVVAALPNPSNGDMGTVLNSDYGTGVQITRIAGTGNGGNSLQMTQSSEDSILANPNGIVLNPVYQQGQGPVTVKVVDPQKVQPLTWELRIITNDTSNAGVARSMYPLTTGSSAITTKGIIPDSARWQLIGTASSSASPVVVYSENNIKQLNEQILEDYGISVNFAQCVRPGDDQPGGNGYISSNITFADPSNAWLSGVPDQSGVSQLNWLRTGRNTGVDTSYYCDYNATGNYDSGTTQFYNGMVANYSSTTGTWGPYALGAPFKWRQNYPNNLSYASFCGATVEPVGSNTANLYDLPSVDIVFTADKSKWTRCVVLEEQEDSALSEGHAQKFQIRKHPSWNMGINSEGLPSYSTSDSGMSWFPGYAVNQETGERLNIVFGEDSWLRAYNGNDMIWNPTAIKNNGDGLFNPGTGDVVFGGKHYIYVANTRYDSCNYFKSLLATGVIRDKYTAFRAFQWLGLPMLNYGASLTSLQNGLIPNTTRVRFRVTRPYAFYAPANNYIGNTNLYTNPNLFVPNTGLPNKGLPDYLFSTLDLAKTPVNAHTDKNALLNRIQVVPNPYYGYAGYELNRLDTRVRITNLPQNATIYIYALDGSLIRTLSKSDQGTSYIDWDLRNTAGLAVSSGMYLMDVKAEGIGETVLRWFGAMRPIDITTF